MVALMRKYLHVDRPMVPEMHAAVPSPTLPEHDQISPSYTVCTWGVQDPIGHEVCRNAAGQVNGARYRGVAHRLPRTSSVEVSVCYCDKQNKMGTSVA